MFLNNLIVLVCNFCFSNSPSNKANIFLGLIEYELNSLLGASHLVDYISVHIRFDLERYLLIIGNTAASAFTAQEAFLNNFDNVVNSRVDIREDIKYCEDTLSHAHRAKLINHSMEKIFTCCLQYDSRNSDYF